VTRSLTLVLVLSAAVLAIVIDSPHHSTELTSKGFVTQDASGLWGLSSLLKNSHFKNVHRASRILHDAAHYPVSFATVVFRRTDCPIRPVFQDAALNTRTD
jgi:hypothetical protein